MPRLPAREGPVHPAHDGSAGLASPGGGTDRVVASEVLDEEAHLTAQDYAEVSSPATAITLATPHGIGMMVSTAKPAVPRSGSIPYRSLIGRKGRQAGPGNWTVSVQRCEAACSGACDCPRAIDRGGAGLGAVNCAYDGKRASCTPTTGSSSGTLPYARRPPGLHAGGDRPLSRGVVTARRGHRHDQLLPVLGANLAQARRSGASPDQGADPGHRFSGICGRACRTCSG